MKYFCAVGAVAVALFFVGRRAPRSAAVLASSSSAGANRDSPTTAPGARPSATERAAIGALLSRLAKVPRPTAPPPVTEAEENIERSAVEPPAITQKRRAHASAEIDQRAPGISQAKREILLGEADRLAWDKRQFRAAFLLGKMSETDYVNALKDDIRASLSLFEESLSDQEYTALFNRARGSGRDPFTLESLVGRPQPDKEAAASGK